MQSIEETWAVLLVGDEMMAAPQCRYGHNERGHAPQPGAARCAETSGSKAADPARVSGDG